MILRTCLEINIGYRAQQRQRHALGFVIVTCHGPCADYHGGDGQSWLPVQRWQTWTCISPEPKSAAFSMETPATSKHTNRAAAPASASSYWVLLALLSLAACCCCCLLLGVDAPTHIVQPHTKNTKHTAAAKAQRNQYLYLLFLALLLHHTGPSRLYTFYGATVAAL